MSAEIEGAAPTPEGPARVKIASTTLDAYFESIEDPFRQTQTGQATESPTGWFISLFVFCLVPAIPYGLSLLMRQLFGAKVFSFRSVQFHVASFWFWWIVSFAVSLLLLILVSRFSGVSSEQKKKWLSPAQMRFAYCYAVVREIRHYKTNQRDPHIDAAVGYFDKTATTLFRNVDISENFYPDQHWRKEILLSEHQGAVLGPFISGSRPSWYRLTPETELILEAFRKFPSKLRDRLKDRKDLASVEAILTDLAAYQYTEIPELSDSKSETRFEVGTGILIAFAQQVIALPKYRSERPKATPKEKLSRRLMFAGREVSLLFTHANVLVAFCAWLILMLLLFWGGFYVALRWFSIKMDSTIMTALIGGPVATAVTGATIPRLGKGKKRLG